MTDRINQSDLDEKEAQVNLYLKNKGYLTRVVVGGRYGYTALDHGWLKADNNIGIRDTWRAGLTKKEAYYMLEFFLDVISSTEHEDYRRFENQPSFTELVKKRREEKSEVLKNE
jgi:hypothetical protein